MVEDDRREFKQLILDLGVAFREDIPVDLYRVFWKALDEYDIRAVKFSVEKWIKNGNKFPNPGNLIAQIVGVLNTKHIGSDEAWTIALKSMDESQTVAITIEIMQARAIAWEIYEQGDVIGARMAFRSAYERIIADAPPPKWVKSYGFHSTTGVVHVSDRVRIDNNASRRQALEGDVASGRLPKSAIEKPEFMEIEHKPGHFGQLAITSATKTEAMILDGNDKILTELQEMREQLAGKNADKDKKAAEMVDRLRKRKEAADAATKIIAEVTTSGK